VRKGVAPTLRNTVCGLTSKVIAAFPELSVVNVWVLNKVLLGFDNTANEPVMTLEVLPSSEAILMVLKYVDAFTVKAKVEVRTVLPAVPVIVVVVVPTVAAPVAVKVNVAVQVGLQEVGEKAALTPLGNPDAVNVTACVVPLVKVVLTEFVILDP